MQVEVERMMIQITTDTSEIASTENLIYLKYSMKIVFLTGQLTISLQSKKILNIN